MPGTPDFQSYSNWRALSIAPVSATYNPGATQVDKQVLTNYNGLYLNARSGGGQGTIAVTWYADSAWTVSTITRTYPIQGTNTMDVIVPALGNSYIVAVDVPLGGSWTGQVGVIQVNTQSTTDDYVQDNYTIGEINQNILHGTHVDTFIPPLFAGWAQLLLDPGAGLSNLQAHVNYVDNSGVTQQEIAAVIGTNGVVDENIIIPAVPLTVRLINTSATTDYVATWSLTLWSG